MAYCWLCPSQSEGDALLCSECRVDVQRERQHSPHYHPLDDTTGDTRSIQP
jgi:hypothetical protein